MSAHSLVELVYAVERVSNPFTAEDRRAVLGAFAAEDSPFEVVPVKADQAAYNTGTPSAGALAR